MIGYVDTGKSFLGCISYDLEDKLELTDEQKEKLSRQDGLQHKDRAEVLAYHKCFGNKYELAEQFRDVSRLSKRVENPVFHFALRLAPDDTCTKDKLIEIGEACAREFEVQDNQYLIILHKDTPEPHIHIVANRVGYDGKVAKDSNSYRRMAALCRRLEKQYNLTKVLSPRKFLPKEQRSIPRHDQRREKLRNDIQRTLEQVTRYQDFEQRMQALGYQVIKGRGIAFVDNKKVRIKGSEVGFSLSKIEQILHIGTELAAKQAKKTVFETAIQQQATKYPAITPMQKLRLQTWQASQREKSPVFLIQQEIINLTQQLNHLLYDLMKPEYGGQSINPELLKEAKRKKKKKGRSL
ncbi:relaxase/mobilization nuclease-like protein [Chitinophaga japonensis]|uniref:Relaxase/mobilization nuclease-like protein n=2 Tax=Chitinophaga japonensis TaxID=104662 RepID=A0A562SNU6_CHIJA|nr:relaxase/mobilization nuclease-like protein [Chitinophaga japonensis]